MRVGFAAAAVVVFCGAAVAEQHLGFEVSQNGRAVAVAYVYPNTAAYRAGISRGDLVLAVGGKNLRNVQDFEGIVSRQKPDAEIKVKTSSERGVKFSTLPVRDADKTRAELDKMVAERGPILFLGRVTEDVLGKPKITLYAENMTYRTVDAVEFKVEMFNKFGDPVNGLAGDDNVIDFLHQEALSPGERVLLDARVPWHETVGVANVRITRYVMNGQTRVPEKSLPYEVRK